MANVCIHMCESMYQIPSRVLCFLIIILQGGVLDYYLISHKTVYWYGWVAADVAILFVFIVAFIISYRHLLIVRQSSNSQAPVQAGNLPLGYFAWFVYSVALVARVAIIFSDFAQFLVETDFFGPNTLKITISLACAVFLLLLMMHHDAQPGTMRMHRIQEFSGTVVFDILDSVDMLDVLFDPKDRFDLPSGMCMAIISISCINFILPIFPLMTLSNSHFGYKNTSESLLILHKLLLIFVVNLPFLIMRLLIWHVVQKDVSIFIVKNLLVIIVNFYQLYENEVRKYNRSQSGDETDAGEEIKMAEILED
ncbi:transmembrane protein 121B-like [Mytilus californianus]|uniref:transmembrane protein 121B-like n=1 Tax=Mytilus californianus TaxID=6549 RepID=UPI002246BD06|nr:transmembrane protein 121B-like [Mytilus californianus]XP_052068363.1 transmembrane protein 121B-like [Mytilus californianus]